MSQHRHFIVFVIIKKRPVVEYLLCLFVCLFITGYFTRLSDQWWSIYFVCLFIYYRILYQAVGYVVEYLLCLFVYLLQDTLPGCRTSGGVSTLFVCLFITGYFTRLSDQWWSIYFVCLFIYYRILYQAVGSVVEYLTSPSLSEGWSVYVRRCTVCSYIMLSRYFMMLS